MEPGVIAEPRSDSFKKNSFYELPTVAASFPSRYSDNNNKKINYIGNLKTEMKNV